MADAALQQALRDIDNLGGLGSFLNLSENELNLILRDLETARLSQTVDLKAVARQGTNIAERTIGAFEGKMNFGDDESSDSELSENIPTAAFRAVTEPQANQMLLIMSQQVSHLQQIEMNTSVLPAMADSIADAAGGSSPFHTYSVPLAARNGGA